MTTKNLSELQKNFNRLKELTEEGIISSSLVQSVMENLLREYDPILNVGGENIDFRKIKKIFHPQQQERRGATGYEIRNWLIKKGLQCLGTTHLKAVERRGGEFFKRYIDNDYIVGWADEGADSLGKSSSPMLYYCDAYACKTSLGWANLENKFFSNSPILIL